MVDVPPGELTAQDAADGAAEAEVFGEPPPEKVDVVFLIPPCWGVDAPPSGASYVSGYLQARGVSVHVVDLNIELYHVLGEEHRHLWRQESYRIWELSEPFDDNLLPRFADWFEDAAETIADLQPRVVAFSINVASVIFAVRFTQLLKARIPGLRTIFGGNQCRFGVGNTHLPPGLFGPALNYAGLVDAVVLGEGERTAHELITRILEGRPLKGVPGAITVDDGFFGNFVHRPEAEDLDDLGSPSFSGYPLEMYRERHLPMLLSRGCRFRCAFCNERLQFERYRARSGDEVFREVARHQDEYGTELFHFCDLVINGAPEALGRFSERVIESGRRIIWTSQAVVHRAFKDPELVAKLRRGGCDHLIFGVESFSEKIMKLMGKPYPPRLVDEVLQTFADNGVGSVINIIVGFPGETEEEFLETLDGLERNASNISMVSSVGECLVSPGSILEQRFRDYGLVLPEKDRFIHWSMPDNTHEIRIDRLERVLAKLKELELGYYKTTRYDEALKENLEEETADREQEDDEQRGKPRFMPQLMSVSPEIDRSSASYSFISTSVDEPTGPTPEGEADTSVGDPGWIYSPVTPMPKPYILFQGRHSQVRLGGRNMDLFFRKRMLSRGPGVMLNLELGEGRVLGSQGGFWSYVRTGPKEVLALCDMDDPGVELSFRIRMAAPDDYRVRAILKFHEPGEPVGVRLGVCLYDLMNAIRLEDRDASPELPLELPPGCRRLTLMPRRDGSPLPHLELDIGGLGDGWSLEQDHDWWIEENRFSFRARIPRRDTSLELGLRILDPAAEAHQMAGAPAEEVQDELEDEEDTKDLVLCRLRTIGLRDGQPTHDTLYIEPGQGLLLRGWIYCRNPVDNPLVRVQIHARMDDQEGLLVAGANNARLNTPLTVRPGCFSRFELVFDELNLAPGEYSISVALLNAERLGAVTYDIHECAYPLVMVGRMQEIDTYLRQEGLELQLLEEGERPNLDQEPAAAGPEIEHLHVNRLAPVDNPDNICTTITPSSPLQVYACFGGRAAADDRELEIQLCHMGRCLIFWRLPLPDQVPPMLRMRFERVNLLQGDFHVVAYPTGRPYAGKTMPLHVLQKRHHGGGLIYCPFRFFSEILDPPEVSGER
jgi:hypothetical protein